MTKSRRRYSRTNSYWYKHRKARAVLLGHMYVANQETLRGLSAYIGLSRNTIHRDLTRTLPLLDPGLAQEVKKLLDYNRRMAPIRGGQANARKWEAIRHEREQQAQAHARQGQSR